MISFLSIFLFSQTGLTQLECLAGYRLDVQSRFLIKIIIRAKKVGLLSANIVDHYLIRMIVRALSLPIFIALQKDFICRFCCNHNLNIETTLCMLQLKIRKFASCENRLYLGNILQCLNNRILRLNLHDNMKDTEKFLYLFE